jgi:Zn-dependent oligopeptidase
LERTLIPEVQQSGIFVLAIFVAVLAERGWQWLRRRAARSWPMAEGRVERAEWRQPNAATKRYFVADLAYSYVVGGQYFAGYYRRSFSAMNSAAAFVQSVKDRPLQVRYKRGEIGTSLLLEENIADCAGAAAEIAS